MKLSEAERGVLADACVVGGWYVSAANIVAVGRLVQIGCLEVEDDYEGPNLRPTPAGVATAARLRIIKRRDADDPLRGGWTYPQPKKEKK